MFNLISVALGAVALIFLRDQPVYLVALLGFAVILFIVLGEKHRLEEAWENAGAPGREAFGPVIALAICLILSIFDWARVERVAADKAEILALILSYAVVSNGMSKSGFFEFAAYKIVEKCAGDTPRLILYLFILSSVLTLFTSNDIVVLTLTPIIYAVCKNARMENGKLLLLSQFVAANTLAMGLMIGSPTNIILSQYFQLDFAGYLIMMIVPAIFSFLLSLVMVDFINRRSRPQTAGFFAFMWRDLNWHYSEHYRVPARVPWSEFTPSMGRWFLLFAASVALLMVVTGLNLSLLWVAAPLTVFSALLLFYELAGDERYRGEPVDKKLRAWARAILLLPYGIVFFAIVFFVFADYVADSAMVRESAAWVVGLAESNTLLVGPLAVIGSGVLVNVFNDLPAAALLGEAFQSTLTPGGDVSEVARLTLIQGILVGVNIGCYLTPVGALAGLLWFSQMRAEERRQREFHAERASVLGKPDEPYKPIAVPTRVDLCVYGALHFLFVGVLIGLFLPFGAILLDIATYPVRMFGEAGINVSTENGILIAISGVIVTIIIGMRARSIIDKNQVALSHMSEIFTVLNSVAIWSFRHPVLYLIALLLGFMAVAGGIVYWAESTSIARYGAVAGPEETTFDVALSGITFLSWFFVLFGSGYEQQLFPQSLVGQFLAGLTPLTALAAVFYVVRSTSTDSLEKLRTALGLGKIPNYRIIIVNHQTNFEGVVTRLLKRKGAFAVLLCRSAHVERANTFAQSLFDDPRLANHVLVKQIDADAYATLRDLDFASASEIFFLADMSAASDIDNMRMLTRIDAWLNNQRAAAVEEMSQLAKAAKAKGVKNQRFGDFLGVPKIYFEASSYRQLERIRSTLSDLVRYQSKLAALDDVVAAQFFADIYGDVDMLRERLRFGANSAAHERERALFVNGEHPFEGFDVFDVQASEESGKALRQFLRKHQESEAAEGRTAKTHSAEMRGELPGVLQFARTLVNGQPEVVPAVNVLGLRAPMSRQVLRMSLATAVMSAQAREADGWVLVKRGPADEALPPPAPSTPPIGESKQIYIFNFNPYAESLVRKIVSSSDPNVSDRSIIIIVDAGVNMPNDIVSQRNVRVRVRKTVEDAVGILMPSNEAAANRPAPRRPAGAEDEGGVRPGDSVLVFTDYEREHVSNVEIVQFIESLDFRIKKAGGLSNLAQRDIYVGVECNNEETRFLFEHLSVDKIIDTSRLRRAYLSHAVDLYHGTFARMRDPRYAGNLANAQWGQFHATMYNFRRAFEFADVFRPYVAEIAETSTVADQNGLARSVVGMSAGEVFNLAQCYSDPPRDLVTICKVRPKRLSPKEDGEFGAGVTMQRMDFDPDYVIEPSDLLVFLPNL